MILLRHGQSEFNVHFTATRRDPGIEDAKLTPLGHAQARDAAEVLRGRGLTRIIASPYTRALQTAAPVGASLGLPVRVHAGIRERAHFACDIGSCRTALAEAWPEHDFSAIDEVWWPHGTETAESVEGRAAAFRAEMQGDAAWHTTLVVSHWAFLLALTGESFENGEWRAFDPHAQVVHAGFPPLPRRPSAA